MVTLFDGLAEGRQAPNGLNWQKWKETTLANLNEARKSALRSAGRPSEDAERLQMALEAAAEESFTIKNGLMEMRDSTELSPQKREWMVAKIAQWMGLPPSETTKE